MGFSWGLLIINYSRDDHHWTGVCKAKKMLQTVVNFSRLLQVIEPMLL